MEKIVYKSLITKAPHYTGRKLTDKLVELANDGWIIEEVKFSSIRLYKVIEVPEFPVYYDAQGNEHQEF